jgi:LysM repeat protein
MGQLEKYGLYVLCLVIFLILGVTIWGGGDLQASPRRGSTVTSPSELVADTGSATNRTGGNPIASTPDLASLLRPVERPVQKPVAERQGATPQPAIDVADDGSVPVVHEEPVKLAPEARPTHKVQAGDSFDSIARRKLGRASLRTEIARLNPDVAPNRLQIGQELVLPTTAELAALARGSAAPTPTPAPPTPDSRSATAMYTIAKGDTLEGIARRHLGSASRTADLRELNPGIEPEKLRIGQKIRIPQQ